MKINYKKQNKKFEILSKELEIYKQNLQSEIEKNNNFSNLKHEAARLNTLIFTLSEDINRKFDSVDSANSQETKKFLKSLEGDINTIYYTSSMISSRMVYADLELNPSALNQQNTFNAVIYKKFDKARYILSKLANNSHKKIEFEGSSFFSIQTISAFDCLPFILLDNAVKYAPKDTNITVSFIESPDLNISLKVTIKSFGPFVKQDDISKLTDRTYRDSGAVQANISGQGLGLYIAKQLCDLHDIKLEIISDMINPLNGIDYGNFTVILSFPK